MRPKRKTREKIFNLLIFLFVLFCALGPRLYFLFFVSGTQNSGPGWYGDVYHHWQIAYLSKTIGFKQGFLRLWDLKGMEYFWGLLHPLALSLLFSLTGSIDILIPRLLSIFCGAFIAAMIYLLTQRDFGYLTALGAGLWTAFFPVLIYTDALGMQDQLALVIFLIALYCWPRKPFLMGLLLVLAGMGRAEYWVFGLGIVIAVNFFKVYFDKRLILFCSWLIFSLVYMKYLLDKTGNPIYPVWWNFLGNAAGEWQVVKELMIDALLAKKIFQGVAVFGLIGSLAVLWKKPKAYLMFLFGFGSLFFNGLIFGFSAYIYGWVNRYYVDRLLNLPYIFLGWLLALFFIYLPGTKIKVFSKVKLGISVMLGLLYAVQVIFWPAIMHYFRKAQQYWPGEVKLAEQTAEYYQTGKILIPEDRTAYTYALVRFNQIKGENIIGQMFDPYFYLEKDVYENWEKNRGKILSWLKKENIKLLVFYPGRERYEKLVEKEKDFFKILKKEEVIHIYEVDLSGYQEKKEI